MSATVPPPASADGAADERAQAAADLGRAFKGALAALRRMRGRERQAPGELSDAQYGVLFCLRDGPERSSGEIALAADLSPASATEMLEGLEHAGLVQRARSERDRRVVLSSLTERGRELVEQRRAKHEPLFRAAVAEFSTDELRTTTAVLERMRQMFDDLADERAKRAE